MRLCVSARQSECLCVFGYMRVDAYVFLHVVCVRVCVCVCVCVFVCVSRERACERECREPTAAHLHRVPPEADPHPFFPRHSQRFQVTLALAFGVFAA